MTFSLNWCWEVTDVGLACVVNKCKFLINLNLCGVVRYRIFHNKLGLSWAKLS